MKKKNKKSGFTLIELVVVIAIIGILAAVITPRIRLSLLKARDAKAVATLDALRTASNVYFAEQGKPLGATTGAQAVALTIAEVNALGSAQYLDAQSVARLVNSANGGNIEVEVGVVTEGPCIGTPESLTTPGKIPIYIEADGVGLRFNVADGTGITGSAAVDTNCQVWNNK